MKPSRQALTILLAVAVFGIGLPWIKGLAFLNPILILCYACLGVLFIAPASTDLGAQHLPPRPMLASMASLVAYGYALSLLMLISGITTVNFIHWSGHVITPRVRFLAAALLLGLSTCFTLIACGIALGITQGATAARTALRTGLLLLVLVLAFGSRGIPEDWQAALNRQLTTTGLTHLAFGISAALIPLGALMTAWAVSRSRVRVQ